MHQLVDEVKPSVAILDPTSNLTSMGNAGDVYATLLHMIDSLKNRGVTTLCTSLTEQGFGSRTFARLRGTTTSGQA